MGRQVKSVVGVGIKQSERSPERRHIARDERRCRSAGRSDLPKPSAFTHSHRLTRSQPAFGDRATF
ncbi:MAG: hypothetical protein ACKVHE_23800, partial [Planctomycetales bacterium]